MRPIVFVSSITHYGGSGKCSIDLIKEIKKRHKVVVLDFYGCSDAYIKQLKENDIEYHIVIPHTKRQIIGGRSPISRLWNMLKAAREIKQLIRLLRTKLQEIEPRIIWLISEKTMFCVGRAVGRRYPTIRVVHGQHGASPRWYCLWDWKNIGMIVGVNYESIEIFQAFHWAEGKLKVIHNGIDFPAVQTTGEVMEDLPAQNAPVKIVMLANFFPLKAHSVAIKGFAKFCRAGGEGVLWICGDTPNNLGPDYETSLRQLCHSVGAADKIHFLGWRSDAAAIVKHSNILIVTSETEGMPRSVLEAMALGKPVIATRVGGIPEVIRDGVDGILIDVGDDDAVAESLQRLENPDIRREMGLAAQQRIKANFNIKDKAAEFLKCVDKVLSAHRENL